jgi:GDP-L-fucose synthase
MKQTSKIYVPGHRGLVGSAILRRLKADGYTNLITRTHAELDLINQEAVTDFFAREKPEYVFLSAAKVGGIHANNTYPAEFIYQNLMIQANIMHASYRTGVKRLLFLGSSCIYPKLAPQPLKEEYLLTGPLEATNEPYAVAKIAGIEMCWSYNRQYRTQYIPVMPTNIYGPNDNFDLETSHVLPALIRKFHLAKLAAKGNLEAIALDESCFGPIPGDVKAALGLSPVRQARHASAPHVLLWGTGTPRREFLYVDDLADACVFLMKSGFESFASLLFNIGLGKDLTIRELAQIISKTVGFEGEIVFDASKPDGTPQKLLDVSRLEKLGWRAATGIEHGIEKTYEHYLERLKPAKQ